MQVNDQGSRYLTIAAMLNTVRFDIIPHSPGWLLTDSIHSPKRFLSFEAAVATAKMKAGEAEAALIFVWENGKERKVYDSSDPATF